MLIDHPFEAIQSIFDCLYEMHSTRIEISYDSQLPKPFIALESDARGCE